MDNVRNGSLSSPYATYHRDTEISEGPPFYSQESGERIVSDLDSNRSFNVRGDSQQHLVLRHNQSGDLYCSKVPDCLTTENFDDTNLELEIETPSGIMTQPCFMRWFLTLLHGATCVISGFCFIFSLFGTIFSDHCLPYLVNKDGSQIKSQFGFTALCEVVLFGLGFVFVVSLLLCGLVQCSLNKTPMLVFSLFLTTCMAACSILGGSTFTIHYALWCDSISQNLLPRHVRCVDAAVKFDRLHKVTNMTAFQTQMELQQITAWALFPLTFITLLFYALAMRWGGGSAETDDVPPPRGFYQYLATQERNDRETTHPHIEDTDERSPFLRH